MLRKVIIIIYLLSLKIKQAFLKKSEQGQILVIKTDAVGDYIIFRNFLQEIANDYKGYKITLMCNVLLKDLAADLDRSVIDDYIYVNHKTLNADWFTLLKVIASKDYAIAINFHYSRTFIADIFAFTARAKKKIAMDGNDLNMNRYLKFMFNLCYHTIIKIPESIINEFAHLKFFTEQIINRQINADQPYLHLTDKRFAEFIPTQSFIVFAPGAAVKNRQSSVSALVDIANFVLKSHTICFIGSPDEIPLVSNIKAKILDQQLNKIIDLTGKTPLSALPFILDKSLGVICNDSGVYHMSVALKKPTLGLTGGGHFDRFVKYPEQKNVRLSYHPMPCFNCDWKCIYKFQESEPYPCISAIEPQNVYENFSFLEQEFVIN